MRIKVCLKQNSTCYLIIDDMKRIKNYGVQATYVFTKKNNSKDILRLSTVRLVKLEHFHTNLFSICHDCNTWTWFGIKNVISTLLLHAKNRLPYK